MDFPKSGFPKKLPKGDPFGDEGVESLSEEVSPPPPIRYYLLPEVPYLKFW